MSRRTFLSAAAAGAAFSAASGDRASAAAVPSNFRFREDARYLMPAHFGPRPAGKSSYDYLDVTTLVVSYRTDRDQLQQYLPAPFEVREPVLSVFYAMNRQVEWLAGGEYNLLGVNAEVRFRGEEEQVDGSFCLVLWEDCTDAIITGREILGIPKIYADIEDHHVLQGEWTTCASLHGHKIVDMKIDSLTEPTAEQAAELRKGMANGNWMGWKYIPKTGRPGAEVSHATLVPTSASPDKIWYGKGEVAWRRLTWEQNPTQSHIVNALADLPILEVYPALIFQGGTSLFVKGNPTRAIR